MASNDESLFSWPSNPSLTALQMLARFVLLATNTIGLSVSFAAAATTNGVSFWVGASFMTASMIFFQPFFILWNRKQLRRHAQVDGKPQGGIMRHLQLDSDSSVRRAPSIKVLKFSIIMDVVGVCGYWTIWGFTLAESFTSYDYWTNGSNSTVLKSYAGTATLTCALIHCFLLLTQLLQLSKAYSLMAAHPTVCPNCLHSLGTSSTVHNDVGGKRQAFSQQTGRSQSEEQSLISQEDDSKAYHDAETTVDMTHGQETGTCIVTPRASSSKGRTRTGSVTFANEVGEGEGDTLIEKAM